MRLIGPANAKPFAKRQKNDAIDLEGIYETAQRPSMRFVAVKSEQQQAAGFVFRTVIRRCGSEPSSSTRYEDTSRTPLQRPIGGKQKLGATSKLGERTLRRLIIIGSSAVVF